MKNDFKNLMTTIRIWARILTYVEGNKIVYLIMFFGYTSMGVIGDYNVGNLLKQITNGVIENDTGLILKGVILFIILSIGLSALGWMVFHIFVSRTKMLAEYKLKIQLFRHVMNRSLPRKADEHSGDSLARLVRDSDSVPNALTWDTMSILWPISSLLTGSVITMIINWKIGIVTLLIGVVFLMVTSKVATPMRKNSDRIKKASSRATQRMMDFLSAAGSVRIMGIELPLIGKMEEATGEVKELSYKNIVLNAWYSTLGSAVGIATTVIILGMGFYFESTGEMELGNVLLIYQFSSSAVYGMVNIGRSLTRFQNTAASAQRVFDIFDGPEEDRRDDLPDLKDTAVMNAPALQIKNLSFKYREELDYVLSNISVSVEKGSHVAIVGESGSGKSTFFKILLGMYGFNQGTVLIEGVSLKDISLRSLREHFAYVSQDSPLFDGSIADNIRMGRPEASFDEVKNAAAASGTDEFISQFPKGYDSEVGELGAKISGGQRQRIAITRAVMKDAPVLLLDEATSSLDSYNETMIQKAMKANSIGKTVIVAAHRLSTVREADMIFVFDNGSIAEKGSHDELLEKNGKYADLIKSQKIA